jgi:diketogulonate reductase-like aldo/keto reductase
VQAFCESHGIRLEGYSPLTRGGRLKDRTIQSISISYRKTTAQIMLRWAIQKGVVVIPKSVHRERIVENGSIFDFAISDADMAVLAKLNEGSNSL